MPFSVRLDPATETRIRRIAVATGRSRSAVVREAVAQYGAERDPAAKSGQSAFDRLRPFIGVISTGGAQSSRDTHAKYRALLNRTHRGRRPH